MAEYKESRQQNT